jgi:hypothetical protein
VGEYRPVDLGAVSNAGLDAIETKRVPPVGEHAFHGIPFQIGGSERHDPCFVLVEPGADPIEVLVGRIAAHVLNAHRRLRRRDAEADPTPGTVLAEYLFRLRDGSTERVPIRERLEIAAAADAGWDGSGPFHAVGNHALMLRDRYEGRWQDLGVRQSETLYPGLPDYFLWVWENPRPSVPVDAIELLARAEGVLVAAITTGDVDEHPFPREAARIVRLTAVGPVVKPMVEPTVEVDRGIASYASRLPRGGVEAFLGDPLTGWGEDVDAESPHAYARIAAVPSATVAVRDGDRLLGTFRWGELGLDDPVESDELRVEVVERGRNWVHVTVLDDETDRPVPCRVHFRSPEGVPYQPHGHPDHVNSDLGTWHIDVGGDLRLGRVSYAYIDGTCQGWLPRGDVIVDVARGFEYEPLRELVRISPGQRELVLRLRRWTSMSAEGWYSGDSHVHFLSTQGSLLEQQGEDLNVVNLLQSQWGSLFTNTEDFTGVPASTPDGRYVTWVSQENRQPFFGHMVLWGLRQPVMPWCTDGPIEADLGAWQETTLSDWADRCHEQGGTVVIPHFPLPNGEPAVLIATDRADAIEMIVQWPTFHAEYYGYLNAGYRLPLVGGTDKMSADVPVGLYRTYARLGDEEFGYDAWARAVRAGRTFLSGGPMLRFQVDGVEAGDTVRLDGGGTVSLSATCESVVPVGRLEVVCNGEVVASTDDASGARRLELRADVRVEEDSWLAARCGGPGYWDGPSLRDPWGRRMFAHTSPVYVACGDEGWSRVDPGWTRRMLVQIEGGITRLRSGRRYPEDRITHHHEEADHQAFLERPFMEALERVRARLETTGG